MRLFVAIDIPEDLKKVLLDSVNELSIADKTALKWTKKDAMHLTLKFIGEYPVIKLDLLKKQLATLEFEEISLEIKGKGGFPHIDNAKVLWAGINEKNNGKLLQKLAGEINARLVKAGIPEEKRVFKPHLTLARVKSKVPENIQKHFLDNKNTFYGEFSVRSFTLYESILKSSGPEYRELFKILSKKIL